MAATIKTTLTDNSKEWVEELKARFIEGGGSAKGFEKHLEDLNGELQSREAAKASAAIKKLADEFEQASPMARALGIAEDKVTEQTHKMGKALDGAGFDADAAAKKLDQYRASAERAGAAAGSVKPSVPGGSSGGGMGGITASGVTAVSTAVGATVVALKAMVEVGKKAYDAISTLAETSPAFATLKTKLDGVAGSAITAAQRFAATDFGSGLIKSANTQLTAMGQGLEALPTLWQDLRTIGHATMADIEEGLGMETVNRRKVISMIQEENAELEKKLAALRQEAALATSDANAQAVRAANVKAANDAEMLASVARMTDRNAVVEAILEEGHALERKRKAGTLTDDAARASISKTAALQAQLRKVEADEENKKKVRQDARKAQFEAEEAARIAKIKQSEEEITANEKKEIEARKAAFGAALRDKVEAALKAQEAANQAADEGKKAAAEKLAKGAQEHKGSAEYLLQNQSATAVARQVAKDRGEAAMNEFGTKNREEYQKYKKASKALASEIAMTDEPDEKKRLMDAKRFNDQKYKGIERQQQAIGRDARQQGFRDVIRGDVTGDEVAEAQSRLAKNVIDHGEQTGRLSKAAAETLRAATDALLAQQAEQRRIVEELGATKDTLRQLLFNGNGHNKGQKQGL